MVLAIAATGCIAGTATAQTSGAGGCGYEVIETLPDGPACGFGNYGPHILAIADDGTVCGYASAFPCDDRAFVQSPGGPLVLLPQPADALGSRALALNTSGIIVGEYWTPDDFTAPCKWVNGQFIALPIPRNANGGEAAAVNSNGTIAGNWANYITGPVHACIWVDGETLVDLHPGAPWVSSRALAINIASVVVGKLSVTLDNYRGFVWSEESGMSILDPVPGGYTSTATAINSRGDVVGEGDVLVPGQKNPTGRCFIWRDGQMFSLGTLPGIVASYQAWDVSDDGRVVGSYNIPPSRLFIWENGAMSRLTIAGSDTAGDSPSINSARVVAAGKRRYAPLPTRASDLDHNCVVNINDLLGVVGNWGATGSLADVNHDGIVDATDLLIVLTDWG